MRQKGIPLPLMTIKILYEEEAKSSPYVAYSPELDISSCGTTEDEAQKNLYEAIELLLQGAAEDGTLKQLLTEAGFSIKQQKVHPPKVFFSPFLFNLSKTQTRQVRV